MQDTTTIETPVGKNKVVIRNWITGKQADHLQSAFFDGLNVSQAEMEKFEEIKIPASKLMEFNHRKIEVYVESVDGNKENVLEAVLGMREEDTAFVAKEIEEVIKKKSK